MKKKNLVLLALLLVTVLFHGCESTPIKQARTIEQAFPDRIEKTVIGMGIDDFKATWPEAKRTGLSENGEIYEFIYKYPSLNYFEYVYT